MILFGDRFKNAWNAFMGRDPTTSPDIYYGGYARRPDRAALQRNNLRSVINTVYNRISVDCASVNINHVYLNEDGKYKETISSTLNYALTKSANVDQTGRELLQDIVLSMLDEGCVAVVPTLTNTNPNNTESFEIYELRVGKIVEWFPRHVRVRLYDERDGQKKEVLVEKRTTAIIENPFYNVMNEPNSTAQRLQRVLAQLDRTNEEQSSGKLNLIIQLPYSLKSEARKMQAEQRRKEIDAQLVGSQHGIAYIDATERVVQLNRSLENDLWTQAKELQEDLFNQLGLSKAIFDGTADEKTLSNYNNSTIRPIMSAIVDEMERKWISRTAQTQGQALWFFRDPFKLVPVGQLAEMVDKFTRNEIMTSNEIRAIMGFKPLADPKADELRNSNLNHPDEKSIGTQEVNAALQKTGDFKINQKLEKEG